MRVLLGLAALAVAVNAQTITPDGTGVGVAPAPFDFALSTAPRCSFNIWQNSVAIGPAVTTASGLPTFQTAVLLGTGTWAFSVPSTVATIIFTVKTNAYVAQLGYRTASESSATGTVNPIAGSYTYSCDACASTKVGNCGSAPSVNYNCASLTRTFTYTGLLGNTAATANRISNSFSVTVFDTTTAQTSYSFSVTRLAVVVTGDPQISGMQGQDFQVHGVPDEVFNMITYPNLQINARFVYLSSAECVDNYTACFAHPGTYISEEGIRLGSDKIHVRAGSAKKGLTVSVNGQKVVAAKTTVKLGSVEIVNHRRVVIKTPIMAVSISNSDKFLNQETQLFDQKLIALGSERRVLADSEKFHPEVPLHGLQGQTWRNVEYPSGLDYEGSVSDYQIQDGNLFGTNFVFNQFSL